MDDENQDLERLERATAQGGGDPVAPLPEDAELRAGWSAFAQLVERADARSTFDEDVFLARFSQTVERRPSAPPRKWWALAVLAASVLLCAAAVGYVATWGTGGARRVAGPRDLQPDSQNKINQGTVVAQAAGVEYGWDDALDERISSVNDALFDLDSNSPTSDHAIESLGTQLEEFRREFDESSL